MSDGKLRQIFREHLPHFHWQAIESGFTGRGIPDANFCCDGIEGWIENKRTTSWKVGISPEQVGWHLRRHRSGGRTFIAVRRQNITKKETVDQLWIYHGRDIMELRDNGIRSELRPVIAHGGGPTKWDWENIGFHLLKKGD